MPGAWAWAQLVRDTDGRELVTGTDGKEHSRGWGEGGIQSHTERKVQRGRM